MRVDKRNMTNTQLSIGSSSYEQIKNDIIFCKLVPGEKLKLAVLKEQYTVSVSTLRETLNRLTSEGFVDAEEQRGFFVKPVSRDDLIEIANLRVLLECYAVQNSIQNGGDEWEGNLVAAYHKLSRAEDKILSGSDTDKEIWKRHGLKFHIAMMQACNNQSLLSLYKTLYYKYLRYQMLVLVQRGRSVADEHKSMFEAALNGEAEKAAQIMRSHILNGLEHVLERL